MSEFRVVIAGGGIAAVEGLLRLRKLAAASVDITLVAPADELVLRPWAVRQPFASGPPAHYDLRRIAADAGVELLKDSLAWVDLEASAAHTDSGASFEFDALLIAIGARQVDAFEHVSTFRDAKADERFRASSRTSRAA